MSTYALLGTVAGLLLSHALALWVGWRTRGMLASKANEVHGHVAKELRADVARVSRERDEYGSQLDLASKLAKEAWDEEQDLDDAERALPDDPDRALGVLFVDAGPDPAGENRPAAPAPRGATRPAG